jgi:hypothetical protein
MSFKSEMEEILNGFEKRMKFVNIVRAITEYRYSDEIRSIFGSGNEQDKLTNIILAVMVFIKEKTLSENQDCTLSDVKYFLDYILPNYMGMNNCDTDFIARYIIVEILQHGGEILSFQTFNSQTYTFDMVPVRIINEEHGKYTLTDDAFDFLFRINDIDETLDYSVTRFKMKEYMKRDNYSEAMEQSRELVSRIRSIKVSISNFIIRCRENVLRVSVDEYDTLITRIRSLLEDEYNELIEIQKNAKERAIKLADAKNAGITYEEAEKHISAINEIISNIQTTIDEQRTLINMKTSLSEQYGEIIRDSYSVNNFERMNFNNDIMMHLRKCDDLGDVARYLLFPLSVPELKNHFSVENFYAAQKSFDDIDEENQMDIEDQEENVELKKNEMRNERNKNICYAFFSYMQDKDSFTTADFINSLRVSELKEYCKEKSLPDFLLHLYEIETIDIEEWKKSEDMVLKPMGELELSWCLQQLPEELLKVQKIIVTKTDSKISFELGENEYTYHIDMTVLKVEVYR